MKINFAPNLNLAEQIKNYYTKKQLDYLKAHVPTNQTNMIEFLELDQKQSIRSMSVIN